MTAKQKQTALVVSAVVVAVTAVVRAWFDAGGVDIGLWGIDAMGRGIRWDNVPGAQEDLYLAGYLACAAALLGAAAVIAFAFGKTGPRFARSALTVALVAMAYFVLRALVFDGLPHVSVGWAMVVGPAAAIAARQLLPQRG